MDFAEDYACRSQDEVQTAYFNMTQVTLHPVVIYFKHDDSLQHKSIVFVSDEPRHDANFVFGVLTELNEFVKEALPIETSYIHYWTLQHHSTVIKNFFMSFATMKNTSIFLLHGTIWKPDMVKVHATQLEE